MTISNKAIGHQIRPDTTKQDKTKRDKTKPFHRFVHDNPPGLRPSGVLNPVSGLLFCRIYI